MRPTKKNVKFSLLSGMSSTRERVRGREMKRMLFFFFIHKLTLIRALHRDTNLVLKVK